MFTSRGTMLGPKGRLERPQCCPNALGLPRFFFIAKWINIGILVFTIFANLLVLFFADAVFERIIHHAPPDIDCAFWRHVFIGLLVAYLPLNLIFLLGLIVHSSISTKITVAYSAWTILVATAILLWAIVRPAYLLDALVFCFIAFIACFHCKDLLDMVKAGVWIRDKRQVMTCTHQVNEAIEQLELSN